MTQSIIKRYFTGMTVIEQATHTQGRGRVMVSLLCLWCRHFGEKLLWCNGVTLCFTQMYCSDWCRVVGKWETGPRLDIKMSFYHYRKSHCGDKTILGPFYLHDCIYYTCNTTFIILMRDTGHQVRWALLGFAYAGRSLTFGTAIIADD